MPRTPSKPSARLSRAAAAELTSLQRSLDTLERRRESLRAELDDLDAQLGAVEEQIGLVSRLAGIEGQIHDLPPAAVVREALTRRAAGEGVEDDDAAHVLRGPAIRETAVRVLVDRRMAGRPIHYRRWHELVEEAGYRVAGKDAPAVFLSQVSRSPVVRRTTESGIYVVDPGTVDELRRRLSSLQRELSDLARTPADATEMAAQRERREQLTSEISQVERGLEEALRVLAPAAAPAGDVTHRLAAAG